MKTLLAVVALCLAIGGLWLDRHDAAAASINANLLKAKKEAETKGYVFAASHDEIVSKAKKESKLRVLTGFGPETFKPMVDAFKKRYPFIDVQVEELAGQEAAQRFLLELKTGVAMKWDVINFFGDFYSEFLPFAKRIDILGMAEQGIVGVPVKMVDPQNRSLVASASSVIALAYNKAIISAEKVPNTWEGFLKPEFKDKKFLVDIKGVISDMAACPEAGMGIEWLEGYAKKIGAQNPIWSRGSTALVRIAAGDYPLHNGFYLHSIVSQEKKAMTGGLAHKIIEPVPAHLYAPDGVLLSAADPYAGLLWLEFQASPEGQAIIDNGEPGKASLFAPASLASKAIAGKRTCLVSWKDFEKLGDWRQKVIAAFGFPKAER
jgi:ABC-type Fe3+ transport system substrate-binding protein